MSSNNTSLKTKTVNGMLWGGLSNGVQQILSFAFGIFLNRMLTPSDYGLVGMILIFSGIASSFQESGFVKGIVNKKSAKQEDYNAIFWTSTGVGTLLYILLFFSAPLIANYYGEPLLTDLSRLVFLGFWIGSFGIAHNAYLFRNLKIRERVISSTIALIISNVVGIFLVYQNYSYWAIAIQIVLYSSINMILFWSFSTFRPTFDYNFQPIRDIFPFSSKVLITNIFININRNVYTVILGRFFSADDLGYTIQPNKWSQMSQSLVSNMITNVSQPVLREVDNDQDRQGRVFRRLISFTAFLVFPMLFGLAAVSEEFITITITERWIQSAVYLQIFCIGAAFDSVNNVFSTLLLSKGKSSIYMRNIVVFGLLQIIILYFGRSLGIQILIALTSFLNILWIFVWYFSAKPYLIYSFTFLCKDVFFYVAVAGISIALALWLSFGIDDLYIRFTSKILLSTVFYILFVRILRPSLFKELLGYFTTTIRRNNK